MKKDIKSLFAFFIGIIVLSSCSKNEYESDGAVSPVIYMSYVKALHNGDDVILAKEKLMGATQIAGVVISDRTSGNFNENELVVQNSSRNKISGIVFKFTDNNTSINYGDSVKIDIENCVLYRENGSMKIKGDDLSFAKVNKVESNKVIAPRKVSLTQLYSDFFNYENTLVEVANIAFPDLIGGEVYNGDVKMGEEASILIYLSTKSTANFAQKSLPLLASFRGIPTYYNATSNYYNTAKLLFKMRNEEDAFNETGATYASFPEDFELAAASTKASYLMSATNDMVTFKTGNWRIYQGIIGDVVNVDKFNPTGKQAIRLKDQLSESAYIEMNFDLTSGASKVTFSYGVPALGAITASTFDLEYSQNGGTTWTKVGNSITDAGKNAQLATFNVNVSGPVRFRINKLGLGPNTSSVNNGFLNIDDFKVYQNVN
ncbi:MAG: DUF5689 domain-containing protein [Pedobacter sp.]|uniref:DUF5689 domain-containing protein n=1 Tax=Pedobacter sp. TaxID=1411316 RepID=UPI00356337AD